MLDTGVGGIIALIFLRSAIRVLREALPARPRAGAS
jgi:hypothetical protein